MNPPDFERAKQYALGRLEQELPAWLTYHCLAHDFNNLLTPMGGFPELLMWKTPEDSQQYEYLR